MQQWQDLQLQQHATPQDPAPYTSDQNEGVGGKTLQIKRPHDEEETVKVKRPRGRPKRNSSVTPPNHKNGGAQIHFASNENKSVPKVKRGRGRPKKIKTEPGQVVVPNEVQSPEQQVQLEDHQQSEYELPERKVVRTSTSITQSGFQSFQDELYQQHQPQQQQQVCQFHWKIKIREIEIMFDSLQQQQYVVDSQADQNHVVNSDFNDLLATDLQQQQQQVSRFHVKMYDKKIRQFFFFVKYKSLLYSLQQQQQYVVDPQADQKHLVNPEFYNDLAQQQQQVSRFHGKNNKKKISSIFS